MKSNWQTKKLGEIFQIERGGSPRPIEKYITKDSNGINWIKIGDTKNVTKYIFNTEQKIIKEGLKKTRLVKEGDFILSNSMSFGRPYLMKTTGAIHDGWLVLREKLPNINKDFFYYLLSSPLVFSQFDKLAAGSTVRNLNTKLVSSVEVPYPIISEQQRIVKILDEVFEKIEKAKENTEKNLQNSHILFETYLNSLFTNGGNNWKEKDFSEVCFLQRGYDLPTRLRNRGNFPLVSSNGITDRIDTWKVKAPGVVTGRSGTIGVVNFIEEDFWPLNTSLYVKIFNGNDERLVYYFLKQFKLTNYSTGAGVPTLNRNNVHHEKVKFPESNSEQKSLVTVLDDLSKHTEKLKKYCLHKLLLLEELKKSVLQKAFAGEL